MFKKIEELRHKWRRFFDGEEIVIYIARPTHPRIKCGASSSDGYPAPLKRRDCGEHSVQKNELKTRIIRPAAMAYILRRQDIWKNPPKKARIFYISQNTESDKGGETLHRDTLCYRARGDKHGQ